MADREIHTTTTTGGSSGIGILGVIIGVVLVLGAIFFFAGGPAWFDGDGGGTQVTIEQSSPSSPAGSGSSGSPATSGSAPSGSGPASGGSSSAPKQ